MDLSGRFNFWRVLILTRAITPPQVPGSLWPRLVNSQRGGWWLFLIVGVLGAGANQKIRQAVTYALNQKEFLQANIGDKRFYRVCKAMFTCDTPLATTAGMDGLIACTRNLPSQMNHDTTN